MGNTDHELDFSDSIPKGKKLNISFNMVSNSLWPLFIDGVQLPQGYSHFEEAVYFLPMSSQKFLVLV